MTRREKPHLDTSNREILLQRKSTTHDVSYPYHRHDSCEIFFFLEGNIRFYLEHTCFSLSPGDLFIISPEEMHRVVCHDFTDPYRRITINIKTALIEKLSTGQTNLSSCFFRRPLGTGNIHHLDESQTQEFLSLCAALENALSHSSYGGEIKKNAYLSLLLVFVNSVFKKQSCDKMSIMPEYLIRTMKYVEEHLGEHLSLDHLGKKFNYNGKYLSNSFKYHTGISLRAYILDRKISKAKSLLRNGFNVTEACFRAGFNDYANFLRSFRKHEGITPGKYMKSADTPEMNR